ncbi:DUF945 domain-containing protein [Thalassotalea euphylliae]|uniref:DUF945 domain-containing protein n=2 Tax=Thalassotalea euphylliae TaxID=1655234 RepID=A0A3E0UII1_9GAMM|nr:DUF945 domain-containing protein [Thalassotalea euphylliae]
MFYKGIIMKKATIGAAIAITGCLILPNFVGNSFQTYHQNTIASIEKNPAIAVKDYQFTRDWFSGEAVTTLSIATQAPEMPTVDLVLTESLTFGPVNITTSGLQLSLVKSKASFDIPLFAAQPQIVEQLNQNIKISSVLSWLGNYSTRLETLAFDIDEVDQSVNIRPSLGEFTLSGDTLTGEYIWQGLSIKGQGKALEVLPLTFKLDQTLIAGDMYSGDAVSIGDFSVSVERFSFDNKANGQSVAINNMYIEGNTSEHDDLLDLTLTYGADEITAMDKKVTESNLVVAIRNLDIKAIQALNRASQSFNGDPQSVATQQALASLIPTAMAMLDHSPEIAIEEFSVVTEHGKLASKAKLDINKDLVDINNPMSVIAAMNLEADGAGPEAFFQQLGLSPMIDGYVQQGLITKDEGKLSFTASFAQGQLKINDKVMPL